MATATQDSPKSELSSLNLEDIDCGMPIVDFPLTLWVEDAGWSSSDSDDSAFITTSAQATLPTDGRLLTSTPEPKPSFTSELLGNSQHSSTSASFSDDSFDWQPFEVRKSPLGGNGVFAVRDIPYGHTILVEDPLFIANTNSVYEAVDNLSPDERQEFNELHAFYKQHNTNDIAARFSTNCFRLNCKADLSGIYTLAARFNHSCEGMNNVRWSFLETPKRDPNTNHVLYFQPNISRPPSSSSSSSSSRASSFSHSSSPSPTSRPSAPSTSTKPVKSSPHSATKRYSLPDEPSFTPLPKKQTRKTNSLPKDKLIHLQICAPHGVKAGEELTLNYGFPPSVLLTNWGFRCACGGCKPAPLTDQECRELTDGISESWEWGRSKFPLQTQKAEW